MNVWEETAALSAIDKVAVRRPCACGEKLTDKEQLAPAATVLPQELVKAKSAEFTPDKAKLAILSGPEPAFESVTVLVAAVPPIACEPN